MYRYRVSQGGRGRHDTSLYILDDGIYLVPREILIYIFIFPGEYCSLVPPPIHLDNTI